MRLLFIYSGIQTLSHLGENVVGAFKMLEKEMGNFHIQTHFPTTDPLANLAEKIKSFRPQIALVFCKDAHPMTRYIRNWAPGIPIGLWVVNDPYHLTDYEWMVPSYDFMLTQDSGCVPYYRNVKKRPAFHVPLAVNPVLYRPMNVSPTYQSDICFVGSAWPGRLPFFDRLRVLLMKKKFLIIGEGWEKLKYYHQLKRGIRTNKIPPDEVSRYYNGAKIVLNIHRTSDDLGRNPRKVPALTPNNRTFDIAACGAFQLASKRYDLGRYYQLGKEMVDYSDITDLKRKMIYYLNHEQQRKKIAEGAYQRTLQEHSYHVRMRRLVGILHGYLRRRN
ncbi:CgeB family protein [Marininema mesophilum]|nr:glycosyltransferase [Marininema mesophilum]